MGLPVSNIFWLAAKESRSFFSDYVTLLLLACTLIFAILAQAHPTLADKLLKSLAHRRRRAAALPERRRGRARADRTGRYRCHRRDAGRHREPLPVRACLQRYDYQALAQTQRENGPIEVNALTDAAGELVRQYGYFYDLAILKSERTRADGGWKEIRGPLDPSLPISKSENAAGEAPVSEPGIFKGGWSQYGEFPQIFLLHCKEATQRHVFQMGKEWVKGITEELEAAE